MEQALLWLQEMSDARTAALTAPVFCFLKLQNTDLVSSDQVRVCVSMQLLSVVTVFMTFELKSWSTDTRNRFRIHQAVMQHG